MDLIPLALVKGGPWAILVTVLVAVTFLIFKGLLIPGSFVDRTVSAYQDSLDRTERELEFWRAAAQAKDVTIATQADQLQKMLSYSAVGTHALEDILREAKKREVGT